MKRTAEEKKACHPRKLELWWSAGGKELQSGALDLFVGLATRQKPLVSDVTTYPVLAAFRASLRKEKTKYTQFRRD